MKVLLIPFYSQQDKVARKFRLESDSGVRICCYMGRRMQECGWQPTIALPPFALRVDSLNWDGVTVSMPMLPIDNAVRRLHWDTEWLLKATHGVDLVFTQHEFLSVPLRALRPELRIVMECGLLPETAFPETAKLFQLAWEAADMLACNSMTLAREIGSRCDCATTVWEFGYNDAMAELRSCERDIDVLFPARASVTEYSNHSAFLRAVEGTSIRAVCTDPTSYLRMQGCKYATPQPLTRAEYIATLHRSKLVVGLTANGYGGWAFREAIACGCIPVALRTPEYEELLGAYWPYYCTLDSIRETVERALTLEPPYGQLLMLQQRNAAASYSRAWAVAKRDMEALCSLR